MMTHGRRQPANCITWGRLAWQVSPTPGSGPGGEPALMPFLRRAPGAGTTEPPVSRRMEGWPWSPPQHQATGESLVTERGV